MTMTPHEADDILLGSTPTVPSNNKSGLSLDASKISWWFISGFLALSSGLLYLLDLANGQRSEYYASIATSMSTSWSNFFFGSIDPGGTITLDKIPGSYWVPALFVKMFGMSTWSVNAPNALATIGTVLIAASAVRRLAGSTAGLIAGLLVMATPTVTAVARSNQPQSFFTLSLALVLYSAVRAFQEVSRKWLVITGISIAIAFQMYMIMAWTIWPALIIAWLFVARSTTQKIVDLLLAGTTSLVLSLTWVVTMWLIPANSRPYIGSTLHNNPFEMVFGYNALGRFSSSSGGMGGGPNGATTSSTAAYNTFTPPFSGSAGWVRLFNDQVAGQIAWLIPTAITSAFALFVIRKNKPLTGFILGWLIVGYVMFSRVAGMHQFNTGYLAMPLVALVSYGVVAMVQERKFEWLFSTVAITSVWAVFISLKYSNYFTTIAMVQLVALGIFALIMFSIEKGKLNSSKLSLLLVTTVAGLALTPAAWSIDVISKPSSINPAAGPSNLQQGGMGGSPQNGLRNNQQFGNQMQAGQMQAGQMPTGQFSGGPGGAMGAQSIDTSLVDYLKANQNGAKYLMAVYGAQSAAPYITQTKEAVLPIGGFSGNDAAPTLEQFKALINSGQLKYVLTESRGGFGGQLGGGQMSGSQSTSSEISNWVTTGGQCKADTGYTNASLMVCTPAT